MTNGAVERVIQGDGSRESALGERPISMGEPGRLSTQVMALEDRLSIVWLCAGGLPTGVVEESSGGGNIMCWDGTGVRGEGGCDEPRRVGGIRGSGGGEGALGGGREDGRDRCRLTGQGGVDCRGSVSSISRACCSTTGTKLSSGLTGTVLCGIMGRYFGCRGKEFSFPFAVVSHGLISGDHIDLLGVRPDTGVLFEVDAAWDWENVVSNWVG